MNNFINLVSILLLMFFGISYLLKLYILRKKYNLHANVLANKNKSKKSQRVERKLQISTFSWILIWSGEIIATYLGLEKTFRVWNNLWISGLGLIIVALGVTFFIIAAITMKNSWRVGIDKSTKSKLITEGVYKYSRNPAFVGFYLMFIGLFLVYADMLTGLGMVFNFYAMHSLVLEEEKHLEEIFNKEYIVYKENTPRYLIW